MRELKLHVLTVVYAFVALAIVGDDVTAWWFGIFG